MAKHASRLGLAFPNGGQVPIKWLQIMAVPDKISLQIAD
jgi:hypothetical protein